MALSLGTSDTFFACMDRPRVSASGEGAVFASPDGQNYMALICFLNGSLAREAQRACTRVARCFVVRGHHGGSHFDGADFVQLFKQRLRRLAQQACGRKELALKVLREKIQSNPTEPAVLRIRQFASLAALDANTVRDTARTFFVDTGLTVVTLGTEAGE